MSIDLSKLSAKELYELAQQKEKEEQDAAERHAKIDALMHEREKLIADHKNTLLLTEKKIREIQAQHDQLIADHKKALSELDKEIKELGGKTPAASGGGTVDEDKLKSSIRQIMNKRDYISAGLLKEKLVSYNIKFPNFNQELEKWVKNGWLTSKGKSNYALGNKI